MDNNISIRSSFERFLQEKDNSFRGYKSDISFRAGIIGGGKACQSLLELISSGRKSRVNLKITGVSDINPEAPGFCLAREMGIYVTPDYKDLFSIEDNNLIIELTGSSELADKISREKPEGLSLMDHRAIRLLWNFLQIELETEEMESEWDRYLGWVRKQSKVIPDSIPYRIMVINMDRSIETVNHTFLKSFNLTEDMIQGKHCYDLEIGPQRQRRCIEKNGRCYIEEHLEEIKNKGIFSTIEEYTGTDGKSRFDVITIAPIYNDRGDIVQILEASRDVTDRIMLEHEAQKSSTFLQNVIQSTVDGIVVVDTKGNVLIFNDGMERLTGFTSDEIINKGHLSTFYDIDLARENMDSMRSDRHGPTGKLNPTSMTIKTKSGEEIPVTLSASIITIDDKEVGSVGIFTDMREILEMRKNLEEAHLQLVQSEKIASVGRMAAGVAHEINNPLSGIMIYAELLKKNLEKIEDKSDQNIKDVQEIIDQTLRCKKIVSELLEFSRQTVGHVTSFTVNELIDKSLNLLINQALFQDVTVVKELDDNLPVMAGDMGQLQQVFTNLFINAVDAMEGKGSLSISARFNSDREIFRIKVSDTGPGIPHDMLDKIFDIFFTTKPVGKGTGLGLSITKNIIQLHGGDITVDSSPGRGTVFSIDLPLGFVEHQDDEPVFIGLD